MAQTKSSLRFLLLTDIDEIREISGRNAQSNIDSSGIAVTGCFLQPPSCCLRGATFRDTCGGGSGGGGSGGSIDTVGCGGGSGHFNEGGVENGGGCVAVQQTTVLCATIHQALVDIIRARKGKG